MKAGVSPQEATVRGVRGILCREIEEALESLAGRQVADRDIHAARKAIKRARGTLRLIRAAIPDAAYRRENEALRDAARPLSAIRDARILIDAVDRLAQLYGPAARKAVPAAFRRILERERRAAHRHEPHTRTAPAPARKELRDVHRRVARWRIDSAGWRQLGAGLQRVYAQGRRARAAAQAERTPERLHEWRKQAKYLWHQLQLLLPLWPGPIGELADQAHKLSDYLGDHHDLAVLRRKVLAHPEAFPGRGGSGALLALIDRCQAQLRKEALLVGGRIYEEKPARFTARIGRYWQQWRRE